MCVDVFTFWDISNDFADVLTIFHGCVTLFQILQRDLVTDWDIRARR